jgi:hypothetical protein
LNSETASIRHEAVFFVTNFLLLFEGLSCKVLLFVNPMQGEMRAEIPKPFPIVSRPIE